MTRLFGTLAFASLLVASYCAAADGPPSVAQLQHCLVSLIDDVKVPAEVPGVLVSLEAKEGLQVEVGTLLAKINDAQPQFQRAVAIAEHKVSKEKAENDVNVRYAEATTRVAEQEFFINEDANKIHKGTVPKVQMQKLWLTVEQGKLQAEQAKHEQTVAKFETEGYASKVDLADEEIRRRQLKAPLNGEVVEVMFRPGEWVEAGNPVMRIVRLDRLRVEGFLNAKDFSPSEVGNRPVRVNIRLARGKVESFQGKITFVNPLVQAGGEYRVWAEVVNRMEGAQWLLRPGMEADMTIDVGMLAALPGGDQAAQSK